MVTLVFLGACCVAASEEAPALNVLEGHKDALYVNVPFSRAILEPLLPDSLMLDSFDDDDSIGWVSIVLDNLVTLDKYIGSPFHVFSPTHCSGWMTKINILVRERPPTNHTSLANSAGYLVTSVDFEAGLAGWMLSTAAQCAQNIPCTLAYYHIPNNSTTNITLAYSSSVRNANDGFYLVVEASNLTNFLTPRSRQFVRWVVDRTVKYLHQPDGTVLCAHQWSVGIPRIAVDGVRVLSGNGTQVRTNVFDVRLSGVGVGRTIEHICEEEWCFVLPEYMLMDHENRRLGCGDPPTNETIEGSSLLNASTPSVFPSVLV
eukprot:GEMP01016566.1.p1 GENE.GEMP01016566.1~~GEMP01016566.1.p1  ORF type:complete len:317 (+),score=76.96 GEMP01016566.1:142-1092(+)